MMSLGSDEFALILPSTVNNDGSITFGERLLKTLSRERDIDGFAIKVSASLGCCLYTDSTLTADQMVKEADAALYEAKQH